MKYNNTKLRLYAFCNFYMNSISQGIQPAHVIGNMAKFYRHSNTEPAKLFWNWLEEGKQNGTIIVLSGGMGADVVEAFDEHAGNLHDNGIPSGIFYEEPRAFGTNEPAPTCWACVLPEELYTAKRDVGNWDSTPTYDYNHPLSKFLDYKNSCGLAR